MHRRPVRSVLPALLVAAIVAGCGSGGGPSPKPLGEDLKTAVAATVAAGTASFDVEITYAGSTATPDGTSMTGHGRFTTGPTQQMSFDADMLQPDAGRLEMLRDGSVLYLRGEMYAHVVPAGGWLKVNLASQEMNAIWLADSVGGLAEPWVAVYLLLGTMEPPRELGRETLDGVPTRRVHAKLAADLAILRATDSIAPGLAPQFYRLEPTDAQYEFEGDAWLDGDDHIRKISYTFGMFTTKGGGTMTATYVFSDFGEPLDIEVPAAADVVDVESLVLSR